jgi:hypothetical protein
MADSPGLSGGNLYFPDRGYAIARQQFECFPPACSSPYLSKRTAGNMLSIITSSL